jgi:putative restriction endonuclease
MSARIPLVYFRGLVPGRYFAEYPTFVVADDPRQLTFTVQCDDRSVIGREEVHGVAESGDSARREYITRLTRQRMHQQAFRERVLLAYHQCCAVCRIRHRPLLDAAHIVADSDPLGIPIVANGLSLCKIHHAAFDYNIMGIRPDLIVEVREDVLREVDGPMLKHGIQELHHTRLLVVPHRSSDKPRTDFLEERYRQFRAAG